MSTSKGVVLGPMEIINEYGTTLQFKNSIPKGTSVWIFYNNGMICGLEPLGCTQNSSDGEQKPSSMWW